jgi:hypothetical protein
MKKIIFTKTNTKMDRVEYFDSGKCIAYLENPKQGILPHDFIHALVESELKIRGFTDLIFEGKKAEFAMKADGEAWLAESMVEAIQGMCWSNQIDFDQFNVWVENTGNQRGISLALVTEPQFSCLSKKLHEVSNCWNALPIGDSFEFLWIK